MIDLRDSNDYATMPESMLLDLIMRGDEKAAKEYDRKFGPRNKSTGSDSRALSRLDLLPSPVHSNLDQPERYVKSPWATDATFAYDPDLHTKPVLAEVNLDELVGTDPTLSRKKIEQYIIGKALTTNGHYALVVVKNGDKTILDGHHRLMAQWLLGNPTAQVWLIQEK